MAGILSGLLGALGGPGNILKKAGEFVGDVLEDIGEGHVKSTGDFGKTLARAGASVLMGDQQRKKQLANARPVLMPRSQLGRGRALKPLPQPVSIHRVTPAGMSDTRIVRRPLPALPPRTQLPETDLEIIEKQAFPKRHPKKARRKRIARGPQRPRKKKKPAKRRGRRRRRFKSAI